MGLSAVGRRLELPFGEREPVIFERVEEWMKISGGAFPPKRKFQAFVGDENRITRPMFS